MEIEFVNHASFILKNQGIQIITDPWLFGTAFNDGWSLLCDYDFDLEKFKEIQYIWFSHEHPDHFSPTLLNKIDIDTRKEITILFQETKDKKLVRYCEKLGYRIQELKDHKKYDLGGGIEVMCSNVLFFDSWLCFFVGGKKILNVNDCVVDGEVKAEKIWKYTGDVDLLLTQFSYAGWTGNINDKDLRLKFARKKLQAVTRQIEVFKPQQVIPFASYVYFSHEESRYMNDAVNTPHKACNAIDKAGANPVVLFPGDVWNIKDTWNNSTSLNLYAKEYANIPQKEYTKSETNISESELIDYFNTYLVRLQKGNSIVLIKIIRMVPFLGFFKPFKIYVTDLKTVYELDILKGLTKLENKGIFDVSMHSQSLSYVFRFNYGFDTLLVSGRLSADPKGFSKMTKNLAIGSLNNTGRHLRLSLLLDYKIIQAFLSGMARFVSRAFSK
jgi:UDP-MurNAc hydroxylase